MRAAPAPAPIRARAAQPGGACILRLALRWSLLVLVIVCAGGSVRTTAGYCRAAAPSVRTLVYTLSTVQLALSRAGADCPPAPAAF